VPTMKRLVTVLGCVATTALGGVALVGCGTSTPSGSGTTTTVSTTTSTPTSTSVPTSTSTAALAPECVFGQLAVTSGSGGGATGHVSDVLLFKNTSTPCTMTGYPGVAGLNSSGQEVVQAMRTLKGFMGGVPAGDSPPIVTLAPGQVASAIVEGTDVPIGTAVTCPSYPALLVTPPNTRQSVTLNTGLPGCSAIEVHPVVMGT
jgi:hypothetical protein